MADVKGILDALMTTWPAKTAESILGALMAPGNAYRSTPDNPVTTAQMVEPASGLAALMALQVPGAPVGAAGIFGGRLAKTANHEALARAENMAGRQVDPGQIYKETGWFKGADGNWRFEIPDNEMRSGFGIDKADTLIDHPQLFNAYPQLKELPVDIGGLGSGGHYNPEMTVARGGPIGSRQTLAHELQHAVQAIEGFDPGSNPRIAAQYPAYWNYVNQLDHTDPRAGLDFHKLYMRNRGETEARNVVNRLDMTPEQRQSMHPWLTQDVPFAEQLPSPFYWMKR